MNYNVFKLTTGEDDENEVLLREADRLRRSPNLFYLPCGFKVVREFSGCFFLGAIFSMWAYNSYFIPVLILLPMYNEQQINVLIVTVFYSLSAATGVCLFRAAFSDPGYVPFDKRATTPDQINWTHCKKCLLQRPLKSHHCRRCQRCVRRMDHHCPWINNCVGEDNHWVFVLLVFYGLLLSIYGLTIDALHFYYFTPCTQCDRDKTIFRYQRYLLYGCFGTGIMLAVFCFNQLFTQVVNIIMDKTTVESLIHAHTPIHEKPVNTKTVLESFRDVFGRGPIIMWLNPFRRRRGRNIVVYHDFM